MHFSHFSIPNITQTRKKKSSPQQRIPSINLEHAVRKIRARARAPQHTSALISGDNFAYIRGKAHFPPPTSLHKVQSTALIASHPLHSQEPVQGAPYSSFDIASLSRDQHLARQRAAAFLLYITYYTLVISSIFRAPGFPLFFAFERAAAAWQLRQL